MSSFKKSSFAMALMVAVGSAQAASVEVYGTVDTGLLYTHESRDLKDNNEKIHESADNWGVASGTFCRFCVGKQFQFR